MPRDPQPVDLGVVVGTFRAMADPTRVRLLLALAERELAVGELVAGLQAPQSSVSRHLAVLRAAGLVATRREATRVFYRLASAHVGDLVVQAFSHAEHERLGLPDHPGRAGAEGEGRAAVEEVLEAAPVPPPAESRH